MPGDKKLEGKGIK
jgi:hypothetical protein